jgi:ubiquinone/menaquinone biosynthesis C-methylase UbiE
MSLNKKPIKIDYSKSPAESEKYAQGRNWYYEKYYKTIIRNGKIKTSSIVVDVPCGGGDFSYKINEAVHPQKLYLIDINKFMIQQAQKLCKSKNFEFIQGSAGDVDILIDGKADVVLTANGFQSYVGDQKVFLKKAHKALKENGLLIFDIVTKQFGDTYTLEFYKKWNAEIVREIKHLNIPIVTPHTKNYLTEGFNPEDMKTLLAKMEKIGYSVTVKKYKEPWTITGELKMWNRIEGRTDIWMPNISFPQRKAILQKTMEKVITEIGMKPLSKHRFFFYAQKV